MKDIFNGNIKQEHITSVVMTMVISSITFLVCGVLLLCLALFYDKIQGNARVLMIAIGVVSALIGVIYTPLTIFAVRNEDKYPRLARKMLKPYVFNNEDENR